MERLIHPHITQNIKLQPHQHGFRSKHSTVTALNHIVNDISNGFNHKKPAQRTILVALDLTAAFDTVNHDTLIQQILDTTIPDSVKRWTINYLQGRQTTVHFRNTSSKHRKTKQGVV